MSEIEHIIPLALGTVEIIILVAVGVVCLAVGLVCGNLYRKKVGEATIGSAEQKAKDIVNEAIKTAETKQKEALLEAKEDIHRSRTEAEKEIRERRNEVQRLEKRVIQKEESLDRRADSYEKKENVLAGKMKVVEEKEAELEELKKGERAVLERISGMTAEHAKTELIANLEGELKHEQAIKIQEYENRTKEEAETKAREIISLAIQRCAADHVAEATISAVTLPNDEMKGRIIGREGRNIRALEQLTGVDLIIDDTPETITISCFDMVRREIARIALVTGVHGIHPELVKLLGRLHYRTSFGQNVLVHSIEVSHIAGLIAGEIGADVTAAKRAGLLHDIGKALDQEKEGSHISIGVEEARRYKENEKIIHAIEAHHGDVEAKSVVAVIVQAADAISAARPGARREDIESYIKRLERLESLANSFKGVERTYAIQAGREIRVMVRPEDISDDDMTVLARNIANKVEAELEYPGQIKVHVIRESRAVEYAK